MEPKQTKPSHLYLSIHNHRYVLTTLVPLIAEHLKNNPLSHKQLFVVNTHEQVVSLKHQLVEQGLSIFSTLMFCTFREVWNQVEHHFFIANSHRSFTLLNRVGERLLFEQTIKKGNHKAWYPYLEYPSMLFKLIDYWHEIKNNRFAWNESFMLDWEALEAQWNHPDISASLATKMGSMISLLKHIEEEKALLMVSDEYDYKMNLLATMKEAGSLHDSRIQLLPNRWKPVECLTFLFQPAFDLPDFYWFEAMIQAGYSLDIYYTEHPDWSSTRSSTIRLKEWALQQNIPIQRIENNQDIFSTTEPIVDRMLYELHRDFASSAPSPLPISKETPQEASRVTQFYSVSAALMDDECAQIPQIIRVLMDQRPTLTLKDIGIYLRHPHAYSSLITHDLDKHKIPYHRGYQEPLNRSKAIACLLDILLMGYKPVAYATFIQVFFSSYVYFKGSTTLDSSPYSYLRTLEKQALFMKHRSDDIFVTVKAALQKKIHDWTERKSENDATQTGYYHEVLDYLDQIEAIFAPLQSGSTKTFSEYLHWFRKTLIQHFSMLYKTYRFADFGVVKTDTLALAELLHQLDTHGYYFLLLQDERISFDQFYEIVVQISQESQIQLDTHPGDAVSILPMRHYDGRSFKIGFFPGMIEGSIPSPSGHSSFFNYSHTIEMLKAGLPITDPAESIEQEHCQFYFSLATISDTVIFSFPTVDSQDHGTLPSYYIAQMEQTLPLIHPSYQILPLTQPFSKSLSATVEPKPTEIASDSIPPEPVGSTCLDLFLAEDILSWMVSLGGFNVRSGVPINLPTDCFPWQDYVQQAQVTRIANAVALYHARSTVENPPQDGSIVIESFKAHPSRRFNEWLGNMSRSLSMESQQLLNSRLDKEISPTEWEDYTKCPFHYLLRHIFTIPEEKEGVTDRLDVLTKGTLYHEVLHQYYTQVVKETPDLSSQSLPNIPLLKQIYDQYLQQLLEQGQIPYPQLFYLETYHEIFSTLEQFIHLDYHFFHETIPVAFETPFGGSSALDPSSFSITHEEFPGETLHFKGKIDRIDRYRQENRCLVIDYKSGNAFSRNAALAEMDAGIRIQPLVYSIMAQRLHSTKEVWFSYRFIEHPHDPLLDKRNARAPIAFEDRFKKDIPQLFTIKHSISSGIFPIQPYKGECLKYCRYMPICRIHELRSPGESYETEETNEGESI